jgi:exosortase/archaeosortase family protein
MSVFDPMTRRTLNMTTKARGNEAQKRAVGQPGKMSRLFTWWQSKHPVFRFVGMLILLLAVWEAFFWTKWAQANLFEPHLRFYAQLCGATLRILGEDASVVDASVFSPRFSVVIVEGCDAIQPVGLFAAAVLASPVKWRFKLIGLPVGALFLMFMNLVRIVILFYVGIHWPDAFEMAHRDISQGLFIVLVVLTWVLWALWAVRKHRQEFIPDGAIPVPV